MSLFSNLSSWGKPTYGDAKPVDAPRSDLALGPAIRAVPSTSLWFGILVWVLFGGSFSAGAVWWLYEDYLFAYHSQPTTGIVERVYTTVSHGRHGSSTTYHLLYHYQVGASTVSGRTRVEHATYSSLSAGEKIPILYIPTQISNNRIDLSAEQNDVSWNTWGISGASLSIIVVGALILRHYVQQNRLYRYLLAGGLPCRGEVVGVPYDLVGKARAQRFYLRFTFTDGQGRSRLGKSWYLRVGDEAYWRVDQAVQVYFDPANSERFTVDLKRGPLVG